MKIHSKPWRYPLAIGLSVILCPDAIIPVAFPQNSPTQIQIVVLEGEGIVHAAGQRTTRRIVVRVEDDDHRPLPGASVVFALPLSGASGEFPNGTRNLTVTTDNDGLAAAVGLRANRITGDIPIYVTASYGGRRARGLITQSIEGPEGAASPQLQSRKSGGKWKWILLGVAAAGGAGTGVYFGTRQNTGNSPISISAGSVVFGSPR